MSKTILSATLSKNSFQDIVRKVKQYKESLNNGVELGVEEALFKLYDLICEEFSQYGEGTHLPNIAMEYDPIMKSGRIFTNDMAIIFNEFGTGEKGVQDEWANAFGYEVDATNRGEEGWTFRVEEEGDVFIHTHGIESRHMFYNALKKLEPQFADIINYNISVTLLKKGM